MREEDVALVEGGNLRFDKAERKLSGVEIEVMVRVENVALVDVDEVRETREREGNGPHAAVVNVQTHMRQRALLDRNVVVQRQTRSVVVERTYCARVRSRRKKRNFIKR